MKAKTLFMAVLLACGTLSASAQNKGDFRIGPTVGMNVASITDSESDSRLGFHVGLRGDYAFSKNLYGGFGFIFTQKGAKAEMEEYGQKAEYKANPGYLQIPLSLGYRYNFGNDVSIFGETGPYLAFGVCGKEKVEYKTSFGNGDEKADFFGDDGAKAFDAGWTIRAGVEANRFQISLGYEYGFTKIWDDTSCHNSNFMVGVTYMF